MKHKEVRKKLREGKPGLTKNSKKRNRLRREPLQGDPVAEKMHVRPPGGVGGGTAPSRGTEQTFFAENGYLEKEEESQFLS